MRPSPLLLLHPARCAAAAAGLWLAPLALACPCPAPVLTEAVRAADVVVEGSIAEAGRVEDGQQRLTLRIEDPLLGSTPADTLVVTFTHCDTPALVASDQRTLWLLDDEKSGWQASACTPRLEATPEARAAVLAAHTEPPGAEAIQQVLRAGAAGVRACFTGAEPLPGKVAPSITIGSGGRVTAVNLGCPDCSAEVVACAEAAMRRLVFPDPGAGTIEISWPWNVDPVR